MPSWKIIWENSMIKKHPIWTVIGIFIIFFILDIQVITSFFSDWQRSEWLDLLALVTYVGTLWVLIDTFKSQQESTRLQQDANLLQSKSAKETAELQKKAIENQSESAERTARMEMAKVLTESFSHSEMFEAIEYFLQVTPYLTDENGKNRQVYIEEINEKPETKKYRYRLLTTLHHTERLYKTEKAESALFSSLITPDIVEVTLCLYKLDGFVHGVDKPVYEMVYKVFESIRRSYLEPYWYALENETPIDAKQLKKTRLVLKNLQAWDKQWGNEGDLTSTKDNLKLLNYLEKTVEKSGAELYFFQGLAKYELKDYAKSIKDYTKAIELEPGYADAYRNRGTAKSELKDYAEAIEDYTKAIELKPDYAYAYSNRGAAKGKQRDYTGVIEDCNKAIEINPQYASAYYNRGLAKSELKHYAEAVADYDKAIKLKPDFADAYTNRGGAKGLLGNYDEAIEDFNKAIELDPQNADAYNNRGFTKHNLQKNEEAIKDYTKAIELKPDYALAYNNRGVAYHKIGKQAEAEADFAEYKRLKGLEQ